MKRVVVVDKPKRRIDPREVAKALGGELIARVRGPLEGLRLCQERQRELQKRVR
jgi:hypothetical protein